MTAIDRLDQIEARANAATEGPWSVYDGGEAILTAHECAGHCEDFHPILGRNLVDGVPLPTVWSTPDDAEFIAHARTDVPALVAALRAVLELHALDPYCGNAHHNPHQCPCAVPACADGCDTYPCPAVCAIEEALS